MPKINLAQETIRNQLVARRRRILYLVSVLVLVVTVGVYGLSLFLTTREQERTEEVRREISRLESQLNAREVDVREALMFRERLKSIARLLPEHVRWSRVLEELERLTTPNTTFVSLKGQVTEKTLTAELRVPSLDAAADFIASLQHRGENKTFFADVVATALKALEVSTAPNTPATLTGYALTLRLSAADEAFRAPAEVQAQPVASPVPVPALPSPVPPGASPLPPTL